MKSVKHQIQAGISHIALVVIILLAGVETASSTEILAVLDHKNKIHQQVLNSLRFALDDAQKAKQIILNTHDLAPDSNKYDNFSDSHAELIVTIGTRASQAVIKSGTNKPVMSVLVPKSSYELLIKQAGIKDLKRHRTAIYIDQPVERQVSLAKKLLPRASNAGVLVSTKSEQYTVDLKAAFKRYGLGLNLVVADAKKDPAAAIRHMMQGSDLVMVIHDPLVLQPITAKWLLFMTYKRRLPVIGFTQAYAKAGALAVVFSTPQQIGLHAGEEIVRWASGGKIVLPQPQYPKYYSVDFNEAVAESLEITLPQRVRSHGGVSLLLEDEE